MEFPFLMTQLFIFLWIILLTHCLYRYIVQLNKRRHLPPGPFPFPLLGNTLEILRHGLPHIAMVPLTERFGELLTIYMGTQPVIVINTLNVAMEAFLQKADDFSHRKLPPLLKEISFEGSILWQNGPMWRLQRRIIHSGFRHIERGEENISSRVLTEMQILFKKLDEHVNRSYDPSKDFIATTARIVCSVGFGGRFEPESGDDKFSDILAGMHVISTRLTVMSIAQLFPSLYNTFLFADVREAFDKLDNFLKEIALERSFSYEEGIIRDIMDVYIDVIFKKGGDNLIPEKAIWRTFFDLLGAGKDTTGHTIQWAIMHMCAYPEYQDRMFEEMSAVCSDSQWITFDLKDKIPLTYATLLEVMRNVSVAPFGVPRVTSHDTILRGYNIPKGTEVWLNEYAVHKDKEVWKDPDIFRPERFLTKEGNGILISKLNQLVSFGVGRRICIGKKLGEIGLFLLFTNLFRTYKFRFANQEQELDWGGCFGLTLSPKPFQVIIDKRGTVYDQ